MRYKVQDDMKDHTPTYTQGVIPELWHKSNTSRINEKARLIDYGRGEGKYTLTQKETTS